MNLPALLFYLVLLLHFASMLLAWRAWKKAAPGYRPMLLFMVFSFLLLFTQAFLSQEIRFLVELRNYLFLGMVLMIVWQAKRWHVFDHNPDLYRITLFLCVGSWVLVCWIMGNNITSSAWYFIGIALLISILAIEIMNRNLLQTGQSYKNNTIFLFSAGLIFYFVILSLLSLIWYSSGTVTTENNLPVIYFYYFIALNIFTQLLYIRSLLCIPAKDKYYSF